MIVFKGTEFRWTYFVPRYDWLHMLNSLFRVVRKTPASVLKPKSTRCKTYKIFKHSTKKSFRNLRVLVTQGFNAELNFYVITLPKTSVCVFNLDLVFRFYVYMRCELIESVTWCDETSVTWAEYVSTMKCANTKRLKCDRV